MMTHRTQKPFACTVGECEKSYCDARSLRRHLENTHRISPEEQDMMQNRARLMPILDQQAGLWKPFEDYFPGIVFLWYFFKGVIKRFEDYSNSPLASVGSVDSDSKSDLDTTLPSSSSEHDINTLHAVRKAKALLPETSLYVLCSRPPTHTSYTFLYIGRSVNY